MALLILRNGLCRSYHPASFCGSLRMVLPDVTHDVWLAPGFSFCCPTNQRDSMAFQSCRSIHLSVDRRKKKEGILSHQEQARAQFLLQRLDKPKTQRVVVWRNMTIEELSNVLEKDSRTVIEATRDFVLGGHIYRKKSDVINDLLLIGKICKLFGKTPEFVKINETDANEEDLDAYPRPPPEEEVLVKRAPVVTIMGHVDHGKTTLLDSLRNSNVVASEFGGITQHIGAFSVALNEREKVTFIDTPGHAAFTSMRSRGAHATDIVVLVVAADDGVMEQTVESIRMAQDAKVPLIVAVNKIDKPLANIKRVEEMLSKVGVHTESMHGDVQAIPISALNGTNLDTLIEAILIQAEMMELKADPTGFVEGIILESRQDPHRGKLASAIIHRGTLRKGAVLVAGCAHAKVRLMFDESGQQFLQAPPSTPVEMMGWRELPAAGELMLEVESEKRAHQVLKYRERQKMKKKEASDLESISEAQKRQREEYLQNRRAAFSIGRYRIRQERKKMIAEGTSPKVSVIIKGDVDGSVEAILDALETYDCDDVPLDIVTYGVGQPTENDIELAATFNSIVYCFNLKTPEKVRALAQEKGVPLRNLNVIYRLVDDLKKEISNKMPVFDSEEVIGEADVLQQFEFSEGKKKTIIIGLRVRKGELRLLERARLIRGDEVLFDGPITSMKHLKKEVKDLRSGIEGGIVLDSTVDVQLGDVVLCYRIVKQRKALDWSPGF